MIVDRRGLTRFRCRIRVQIRVRNNLYQGYALDISEEGMRISTDTVVDIWTGDDVEVESEELGMIIGRTLWREPGEFGIKFEESTNTAAKVNHIRKYFGPPIEDRTRAA
ncbi:PilZ domain-containing protein [Aquibium sp. ELW1220]|uniref:PilZ domain-containing protein n=1 Tax=Aquibium sp. ELW1220 TaxID=2976766 RepID=UPI0025B0DE0E|nr:PilZ domain-containing protein [Aquibium sp. ELW1220]MDN2578725.1 PilZ domain-containing protein [Aquibium sp. ELW1220]